MLAALEEGRQRNQKEPRALVQPQLCHHHCVTLGKSLWSLGSIAPSPSRVLEKKQTQEQTSTAG